MTETLVDSQTHHAADHGTSSSSSAEYQHATTSTRAAGTNGPLLEAATIGPVTPKLRPEVNPANGSHDGADVGTVMLKAKKAAQSIWVLVHAQNCRIGGDRCPHKGCTEAKRVLLHLKVCPSGSNACACSMNYNGCQQSRKLLAHYKKCREIRAKQAGMGRRAKNHQHVCLVCSLVARHARNVLEGSSSRKSTAKKQVIASFTLAEPGPDVGSTNGFMPPPPPRQRGTAIPITSMRNLSSSDSSDDGTPCEIPPTRNQLMLFSEVAIAAAPPAAAPSVDPVLLGKSLDSSKSPFLNFAVSALQNLKKASPNGSEDGDEEEYERSHPPLYSPRRSRAESYDERAHLKMTSPAGHHRHARDGSDPTLELDLKGEQVFDSDQPPVVRRSRSASLGVLASACSVTRTGTCATIEEEEAAASLAREEEAFAMDE